MCVGQVRWQQTNCKYITLTYSCVVVAQTPNTVYNKYLNSHHVIIKWFCYFTVGRGHNNLQLGQRMAKYDREWSAVAENCQMWHKIAKSGIKLSIVAKQRLGIANCGKTTLRMWQMEKILCEAKHVRWYALHLTRGSKLNVNRTINWALTISMMQSSGEGYLPSSRVRVLNCFMKSELGNGS